MNIAGCNFEWLTAPLLLFTRSDRLLFLINWLSYLLLPGLVFSVYIRLGIRRRVAWWWMWLAASGWCYALEAGSTHNDSMATIYILAAVYLALRARERQSYLDLFHSLLATALVTGVKQTNIPLVVVGLVAVWPCRSNLWRRPLLTLGLSMWCLVISAATITALNIAYAGKWNGIPEGTHFELPSPLWGVVGNCFCLPIQNLMPPFFPWADGWDHAMENFLKTPLGAHFTSFEHFGYLRHGISEESAGIGLGISCLILLSLFVSACHPRTAIQSLLSSCRQLGLFGWVLRLAPWPLLLLYMAKVGTFQNARQLAPYYPLLLLPLLALPVHATFARQIWWRLGCLLLMLVTVFMLVISRSRPFFPTHTIITRLASSQSHPKLLNQLQVSYGFMSTFELLRHPFSASLPTNESTIGYLAINGLAEPGLTLPFGQRNVERPCQLTPLTSCGGSKSIM